MERDEALLTQSAKTVTIQPCLSRSTLPGRHTKAAILNHVSRRTSNDYWASAYFNINSLEAGIVGGWGQKSAAAGRILGALWLRPLCFIEAIFQCLLWQHLRLLNCRLQGKSKRGREEVGGKRGEWGSGRTQGLRRGGKTDGYQSEKELLTKVRRRCQVSFGCWKSKFLWFVCVPAAFSVVIYISGSRWVCVLHCTWGQPFPHCQRWYSDWLMITRRGHNYVHWRTLNPISLKSVANQTFTWCKQSYTIPPLQGANSITCDYLRRVCRQTFTNKEVKQAWLKFINDSA